MHRNYDFTQLSHERVYRQNDANGKFKFSNFKIVIQNNLKIKNKNNLSMFVTRRKKFTLSQSIIPVICMNLLVCSFSCKNSSLSLWPLSALLKV